MIVGNLWLTERSSSYDLRTLLGNLAQPPIKIYRGGWSA
jgi:hypothetical protein